MKLYWTAYDMNQFADVHFIENFNLSRIREHNYYWPAGTTIAHLEAMLSRIIAEHGEAIALPADGHCGPGIALYEFSLDNGLEVCLGINSLGRIMLFQPLNGPNVIKLDGQQAQKLFDILRSK